MVTEKEMICVCMEFLTLEVSTMISDHLVLGILRLPEPPKMG